jgi:hypothetical protein
VLLESDIYAGVARLLYTATDGLNLIDGTIYLFGNDRDRFRFQRYDWDHLGFSFSDTADANKNGINNLLEYALGGDYTAPDTSIPLVHPRPNLDPLTSRLQLVFNRYLARTDLQLTVQAADSPAGPWIDIARSTGGNAFTALVTGTGIAETGTGDARQVTVTDPISGPRRFLRLAVNSP